MAAVLLEDLLNAGISFSYETVFSHESKIDLTARARALGYEIIIVYIHLENTELNEARVHQRVSEGGHNVPADKIRSRIPRTMKNISTALLLADEARMFDNSSKQDPYRLVAVIRKGERNYTVDPQPSWAGEILKDIP